MCGRDDDPSMIDKTRLTTLLRGPHQYWCSCLLAGCDCGRDQQIVAAAGVTAPRPELGSVLVCPHGAEWDGRIWTKVQPAPDVPHYRREP